MITKRIKTGDRCLTRDGMHVGPVDIVDANGWAWVGDQCWDALTGRYYANIDDGRDMVTLIPEEDFQHWLEWMGAAVVAPTMTESAA